jgi:hypothetical protein
MHLKSFESHWNKLYLTGGEMNYLSSLFTGVTISDDW